MDTYAKGPLTAGLWLGCSSNEARENHEFPRKISQISKAFSAMITAAVNQASAATHQELANWPILLLSHVNCTSGTSAKGN